MRQDGSKSRVLRNVKLSDIARNAIKELWPLSVGRTAKYTIQIVDNTSRQRRWDVDSVVSETENITVSGKVYPVYIINQTARLHSRKYPGDYRKTSWYDPVQGVIVRERIERTNGYNKGKISEISLVNMTFPQDAPHITRVVPQAPAAQPLQVQRPPPQPKVAALPPPKPPVQKAVEVALDKSGPAIEIPASIETDQSVVEIAGRILDNSRIIEVHLDGRPVPMAADGSISVRRGVPAGMTTFTIAALDEWGNASNQSVTVTRTLAVAPKAVAGAKAAPQPVAKVAVDNTGPKITLPESHSTTERTVRLVGQVSDASKVIDVTVEGRSVALGDDGSIVVQRALSIGANTIRVAALDEWGNKAERRISVERRRPFADINFGTYHAIVIGNNDYAGMPKLKTAVTDAQAVARTLQQDYGYTVNLLINATRADIINSMAKARASLKANDNLLIY